MGDPRVTALMMRMESELASIRDKLDEVEGAAWRERRDIFGGEVDGAALVPQSFDLSLVGTTATISAGTLRVHGIGKYAVSGSVSLSGATEWIYVKFPRGAAAATLEHQATEPDDAGGTDILWPLYYLAQSAPGVYYVVRDCRTDIHL